MKDNNVAVIVIDDPDGTGKSTLANKIYEYVSSMQDGLGAKCALFHQTYNSEIAKDVKSYHTNRVLDNLDAEFIILDRWAASEYAYGHVFRDGPSYDVVKLFCDMQDKHKLKMFHIFANNSQAVKDFESLKQTRDEMFSSRMDEIQEKFVDLYHGILSWSPRLNIREYDRHNDDVNQFIKNLFENIGESYES